MIMGDKIFDEALAKRNKPWISAYWKASLPDLRATLQRNIDADYDGVAELENAPVNTDAVEGNMGVIDQLRHKSQAHVENCFGMSMVNRMQLFSTKEQEIDRQARNFTNALCTYLPTKPYRLYTLIVLSVLY